MPSLQFVYIQPLFSSIVNNWRKQLSFALLFYFFLHCIFNVLLTPKIIWQRGRIRAATINLVDEIILVTGGNIKLPSHLYRVGTRYILLHFTRWALGALEVYSGSENHTILLTALSYKLWSKYLVKLIRIFLIVVVRAKLNLLLKLCCWLFSSL